MSLRVAQGKPGPVTAGWPITQSVSPMVTDFWSPATKVGSTISIPCAGYSTVLLNIYYVGPTSGSGQNGQWVIEVSDDGAHWYEQIGYNPNNGSSSGYYGYSPAAVGAGAAVVVNVSGFSYCRIRLNSAISIGVTYGCIIHMQATSAPLMTAYWTAMAFSVSAFAGLMGNMSVSQIAGITISTTSIALQASQVSGVANATTTRTTTNNLGMYKSLQVVINITAAGAGTGTLQLFLEDSCDGGTTWDDVIASNTFTFGGSLTTQVFFLDGNIASSATQGTAAQVETLTAGTVRQGPFGDRLRVREKVSGVGGSPTGVTYAINCIAKL